MSIFTKENKSQSLKKVLWYLWKNITVTSNITLGIQLNKIKVFRHKSKEAKLTKEIFI